MSSRLKRPLRFAACVLVTCYAGSIYAESGMIVYRAKDGVFSVIEKGPNRLKFSFAVGYLNPQGRCSQSEIWCEMYEGTATGANGSYQYQDPDDPGSGFTITLSGNAVIISNAHGGLGTGSANGGLLQLIDGRYFRS